MRLRYERRLKTVTADRDLVLDVLRGIQNCEIVSLPGIHGIPEDAYLENISYDWARDAFVLLLSSQEFEPVPPSDIVPNLDEIHFTQEAWIRKDLLETHSVK